jgi:tetratricopeptide (TPR) repeat protein
MRDTLLSRFTPSLLSGQALERMFVQREPQAAAIVAGIRDSVLTKNKHYCLVTGPRGMGKTHLVSLIYHRVVKDPELAGRVVIAWLREDAWGIASYLDLLLAIVRALEEAKATPAVVGAYQRIVALDTAEDAEAAAEGVVLAAAGAAGALLLICENLDAIFEGLGADGQHKLRALFQNHPLFTVLATSQSLFDDVTKRESPFYGFFRPVHLREFSLDDAVELLAKVAEHEAHPDLAALLTTPTGRARVRVVHHLAAGNPRVYIIFSTFLTRQSLDELVGPLMQTLDDLTPYYQARMAHLSPQQRKLVEYLCEQRAAVQVHTIASANFITPQTVSGQLRKLAELGYVQSTPAGREVFYELREPLLRLTLEVKKHRGAPVQLILEFLRLWYSESQLATWLGAADSAERGYLEGALALARRDGRDVVAEAAQADLRRFVAEGDLHRANEAAEDFIAHEGGVVPYGRVQTGFTLAQSLLEEDRTGEAAVVLGRVVVECGEGVEHDLVAATALVMKAVCFARVGRVDDAVRADDEVVRRYGESDELLVQRQVALAISHRALQFAEAGRTDEALRAADDTVLRFGNNPDPNCLELAALALGLRAVLLTQVGRLDDALGAALEVVHRFGDRAEQPFQISVARALAQVALIHVHAGRVEEGLRTADEVVRRFGQRDELTGMGFVARVQVLRAFVLASSGRVDDALRAADEVVRRFGARTEPALVASVVSALWFSLEHARDRVAGDLDLQLIAALLRRRDQWDPSVPVSRRVVALFSRAMTLAGVGEQADSDALAADAAALLASEPGGDHAWAACLVPHLLRREPSLWAGMIARLVAAFDAADALTALSVGLAWSVRVLVEQPDRDGDAWLRAWTEPAAAHPQLEVGLRMLRVGVQHLRGDATALHRLASEERALLRELLPP